MKSKNTIELAAEFIRRAAFVDANALLKDECGVEYKNPSQVQYYALFKDHDDAKAISRHARVSGAYRVSRGHIQAHDCR